MLQALRIEEARAIARAARERSRDERAMVDYLGVGQRRHDMALPSPVLIRPTAVDLAAFESSERHRLRHLIDSLSEDSRRELIALVFMAQRPSLDFAASLRRTRRIPVPAQTAYLMGVRLERHIEAALSTLGYRDET